MNSTTVLNEQNPTSKAIHKGIQMTENERITDFISIVLYKRRVKCM